MGVLTVGKIEVYFRGFRIYFEFSRIFSMELWLSIRGIHKKAVTYYEIFVVGESQCDSTKRPSPYYFSLIYIYLRCTLHNRCYMYVLEKKSQYLAKYPLNGFLGDFVEENEGDNDFTVLKLWSFCEDIVSIWRSPEHPL